MDNLVKDKLVCQITKDILENSISSFGDLMAYVAEEYKDEGILTVSSKTSYFKELIDSMPYC